MEKEILLKEIENTNHLNELYQLWNEFKAYLENQPSLLELGQLFGFNYHLQEKFKEFHIFKNYLNVTLMIMKLWMLIFHVFINKITYKN